MLHRISACVSALILFTACGKNDVPQVTVESAPELEAFFTPTAPADAMQIHIARESAQPGSEITLTGRVMGRAKPFVDGRAALVLGDRTILTPCNEKPDDACATPWDVCCDSAEDKRKGTATIQIVGADGRVISQSLRGMHGLVELSTVTVHGTVAEGSSDEALIVNASAIHVHP
jgi:hypothetical protein